MLEERMFGLIFVAAVFGGLIWLFVWSIKRAKRKFIEQKAKTEEQIKYLKELEEQKASDAESGGAERISSLNKSAKDVAAVESKENPVKGLIIAIIYIMLLWPLRFFEAFFYTFANMDSGAWFAKLFGYKPKKCRYCGRYFSPLRHVGYACKKSPTGKHRE
jgi:hypothetical protein